MPSTKLKRRRSILGNPARLSGLQPSEHERLVKRAQRLLRDRRLLMCQGLRQHWRSPAPPQRDEEDIKEIMPHFSPSRLLLIPQKLPFRLEDQPNGCVEVTTRDPRDQAHVVTLS